MPLPRSLSNIKREITEKKWAEARKRAGRRISKRKFKMPESQRPDSFFFFFFFCLFITRMRPMEIMARVYTVRFLSAVRAVAARFKHPFALRPGLSHEDVMRTKGITKEKERSERDGPRKEHRKAPPNPLLRTP